MHHTNLTVFYDGSCPLCLKEIRHYQCIEPKSSAITWVDISLADTDFDTLPFSYGQAMRELHCLDEQGYVIKGAYSFIEIWDRLPYYHWLSRLIKTMHLTPLLQWGYQKFATWRISRQCDENTCRR